MPEKFLSFEKIQYTPHDNLKYVIHSKIIKKTEDVLNEYRNLSVPNEGLVYLAGTKLPNFILINAVVAPKTQSHPQGISIAGDAFYHVVKFLNKNKIIQLGQAHSHPTSWIDHSVFDDEGATSKVEGLISIVVPNYGLKGMLPLAKCGIHRFSNGEFIRLTSEYISQHFSISNDGPHYEGDFRQ